MSDCIESHLKLNNMGYPLKRVRKGGKWSRTTHSRVVYAEHHGLDPFGSEMKGMHVDHLCRNPPCINPDHLELVPPAENVRRGVRSPLNEVAVRVIRHLVAEGRQQRDLAAAYGVAPCTVSHIVNRRVWS